MCDVCEGEEEYWVKRNHDYCFRCGAALSGKAKKEAEERSAGEIRLKLETFESLMKLAKEMNGLKDDIKLLKSRLEVAP